MFCSKAELCTSTYYTVNIMLNPDVHFSEISDVVNYSMKELCQQSGTNVWFVTRQLPISIDRCTRLRNEQCYYELHI